MDFQADSSEPLLLLEGDGRAFIGRKKSVQKEYGFEGLMLVGRSVEKKAYGKPVYLDAISPHVVFVCGARGSGKSYLLGNLAEELTLKNPNVACVIIDPVGIFWSMKYPNKDPKELELLSEWGLEPKGIEKTRVFVPAGLKKKVPKGTYDALFSIRPSELTVDDWCLTFNLDRFSPTGLLLEKSIERTREKHGVNYSLDDILQTISSDPEIAGKEKGYASGTRRALMSRLEAAKSWGVLSAEGTPLADVCVAGTPTVIDISFLDENVASLVIGILARRILNARKLVTRKETMKDYIPEDLDEVLETEIPPTWLFIDEAHTLIPSGGQKTAATDALVEYVKQGRRPGCSLVFATQQPSAIDTKVLSQLDILFAHKLVFDDDLKAVMRRMPTLIPKEYEKTRFLKTLPVGIALVGDRSDTTSRAFVVQVRPRFSQHEGREVVSKGQSKADPEKVSSLMEGLLKKKIEDQGSIPLKRVDDITMTMNSRYGLKIDPARILSSLTSQGFEIVSGRLVKKGAIPTKKQTEKKPKEETKIIQPKVSREEALSKAKKLWKTIAPKGFLGLFAEKMEVDSAELEYHPILKVSLELVEGNRISPATVFITPDKQLLRKGKKGLAKYDLSPLSGLTPAKVKILQALSKPLTQKQISKIIGVSVSTVSRHLNELESLGLVEKSKDRYKRLLDLPNELSFPDFSLPVTVSSEEIKTTDYPVNENELLNALKAFGKLRVKSAEKVFLPMWVIRFKNTEKMISIEAV